MARNKFEKPAAVVVINRDTAGLITSITLNGEEMPSESIEHALRYGVNQWCQDGGAGAVDQAAYTEGFNARLERLRNADFSRAKGEGREAADPIGNAAKSLARDAFRKALAANGAADTFKALDKDQKKTAFEAFFEANAETFRKEAEKAAAASEKAAGKLGDDFLGGLLAKAGGNA